MFRYLVSVNEALDQVLPKVGVIDCVEEVGLQDAVGRVLAKDIVAPFDVPPFDRAAVDGYAVRAEDTFGASRTNPIRLPVRGFSRPGSPFNGAVGPGEAVEIATGAPLPPGTDAVVPYEDTKRDGDHVEVYRPVSVYGNVSRAGEDLRKGETILAGGTRLRPWDVAVFASVGYRSLPVRCMPRVGLITTGNEVVEPGEPLGEGQVYNSTRVMVEAMIRELGGLPKYYGIWPDDEGKLAYAIARALEENDMVITTGGVSVGKVDHTVRAVQSLGSDVLVHGIAVRPGRPNSVALVRGKPVVMLSGFPVAALVGFEVFARPILLAMLGTADDPRPTIRGRLTRRIAKPINTRAFVRVRVYRRGSEVIVEPLALTGSGILSTLSRGNGLLVVPEDLEGHDEGDIVEVQLLRPPT